MTQRKQQHFQRYLFIHGRKSFSGISSKFSLYFAERHQHHNMRTAFHHLRNNILAFQ